MAKGAQHEGSHRTGPQGFMKGHSRLSGSPLPGVSDLPMAGSGRLGKCIMHTMWRSPADFQPTRRKQAVSAISKSWKIQVPISIQIFSAYTTARKVQPLTHQLSVFVTFNFFIKSSGFFRSCTRSLKSHSSSLLLGQKVAEA